MGYSAATFEIDSIAAWALADTSQLGVLTVRIVRA
jgi:hypothetical protein